LLLEGGDMAAPRCAHGTQETSDSAALGAQPCALEIITDLGPMVNEAPKCTSATIALRMAAPRYAPGGAAMENQFMSEMVSKSARKEARCQQLKSYIFRQRIQVKPTGFEAITKGCLCLLLGAADALEAVPIVRANPFHRLQQHDVQTITRF